METYGKRTIRDLGLSGRGESDCFNTISLCALDVIPTQRVTLSMRSRRGIGLIGPIKPP